MAKRANRYMQIIERVFFNHYQEGAEEIPFDREEIIAIAETLGIKLPKNLGDIIYTFRYRASLPESVKEKAPKGKWWIIRPAGRSRYCFVAAVPIEIVPNPAIAETKVPDATPGIIELYALSDEQALLAKLRYNRLIDIITGITCYSLQSHLRTHVNGMGQVETDEIYVGIDRKGIHYVLPVQAKGGNDRMSIVQIEQDFALCAEKFPGLVTLSICTQFMANDAIAIFMFENGESGPALIAERHYRLVPSSDISSEDLQLYKSRLP